MTKSPSVLVISFFPAFTPANSGGEMRLGSLYRELSREYQVTLLSSTDFGARFEEIWHTPNFREFRFPKDELWRKAYATLDNAGVKGELSGLAFSLAVGDSTCKLRIMARKLAKEASVVFHEFPYSEPIFSDNSCDVEVYNSHNAELSLLPSIVHGEGLEAVILKVLRLEGNLIRRAKTVFATSTTDAEIFRILYGADASKLKICPNGYQENDVTEIAEYQKSKVGRRVGNANLLFTGSAHHPNVDAAKFIFTLAAELTEITFTIAGGVCAAISNLEAPPNVVRFGPFDEVERINLLKRADVYLNPVVLGSGTSLKALECLGAGIPMVTTPEGVRGLGLVSGVHAVIAGRENMASEVSNLLTDENSLKNFGSAGRLFAQERFSWSVISRELLSSINDWHFRPSTSRPLILALNDYSIHGRQSGGAARVRNLLSNLDSDVALVTFGEGYKITLLEDGLLEINLPKSETHLAFEAAVNRNQQISANDIVASLFLSNHRVLCEFVSLFLKRAHAIIFEHPYMAPILDAVYRQGIDLSIIYSAHNIEHSLKAELLRHHPLCEHLVLFVEQLEQRLIERSDLIVCCTDSDARHFAAFSKPTILVPNGCEIPNIEVSRRPHDLNSEVQRVGFLGSSHGPNVSAATFIISVLAPKFPNVKFEFVGSVCDACSGHLSPNIVLHGVVTDKKKSEIMLRWDVAINPVQSGGGSSLKLPDYMSHGLPTISTQQGARGFIVEEIDAGRVVQIIQFEPTLREMLADRALLARQGANARTFSVNALGWQSVTREYRQFLKTKCSPPPRSKSKSLLVVTYRYTEPSLGGAEEYLVEVLKRLRNRFDRIDLATIDLQQITNQYHFASVYSEGPGAAGRIGELFDQALYFKGDHSADQQSLIKCRDLERAWAHEEFALMLPFVSQLKRDLFQLLSGFFFPEIHGNVTRRWTSPEFSFVIPQSAQIFQMRGYAFCDKVVTITLFQCLPHGIVRELVRYQRELPTYFDIYCGLPSTDLDVPLVLKLEVGEHHAHGDHRPFGVLLEAVSVLSGGNRTSPRNALSDIVSRHADLSKQLVDEIRVFHLEEWAASLYRKAMERTQEFNEAFAAVRGPHSPALQSWIGEHGDEYDVVLVQGIPFDVIPRTVETAFGIMSRPRIVTLPHFHGDDRFYYWADYFRSFSMADRTLLFSDFLSRHVGRPEQFALVPGGGVRVEEACDMTAQAQFSEARRRTGPFFLVLGRKTGSKGYEQTVRAFERFRRSRPDIELLMIGPDDDGLEVVADGVSYIGRQPRGVIRGALMSCIALVTMSQSESFGIVVCEAWLFRKPVIANANCYAFRELVRHEETGLLVSTDDELAEAMHRLAGDLNVCEQMGTSGFGDVINRFSWEKVAAAVNAELAPILGRATS